MHDRNIFKYDKPNFEKLAVEYKQFAPYVQKGLSGKSYVNFKDPASLRALSVVLLNKYYNLAIDIPLDRLIPTIPLRLNYIHWVEDLLQRSDDNKGNVFGIDIGCGASCVFPLLGCKIDKWKFIATEVDKESVQYAEDNVKRNNMEESIKVLNVSKEDPPLSFAINSVARAEVFDFCMCNPPFFSEIQEVKKNRTDHRPPPDSISTASEMESFTEGGEVEFVKRIIDDSMVLKEKVRWYTSMIGKKSSKKHIIKYLLEKKITEYETTIFKQGKTSRWGIAWSFTELVSKKCRQGIKEPKPLIVAPSNMFYLCNDLPLLTSNMDQKEISNIMLNIAKVLSKEFKLLQISSDEPTVILIQNRDAYLITGKACKNTWVHDRRRRRRKKHDKEHADFLQLNRSIYADILQSSSTAPIDHKSCERSDQSRKRKISVTESDNSSDYPDTKCFCDGSIETNFSELKGAAIDSESIDISNITENVLFEFSCTVGQTSQFSLDDLDCTVVSFLCLNGKRDECYQMFTYFKNFLDGTQMKIGK